MANKTPDNGAGFTLVELMVTLAVLGILAGLTASSFRGTFSRWDAKQAANSAAGIFKKARNKAMSRGEVILARVATNGTGAVDLFVSTQNTSICSVATAANNSFASYDPSDHSSQTQLYGQDPDPNSPMMLCFTPDGRLLGNNGNRLISQEKNCGSVGRGYRLWMANRSWNGKNPFSSNVTLEQCVTNNKQRKARTQGRTQADFWVVRIPTHGIPNVIQ